jgi:hypothetical protein
VLSDRVKFWLLERLERGLGRYEEAQRPPDRLREAVVSFANEHPKATRGEWIDFAARFAEESYGSGYIRGVEWAERDPEAFDPTTGFTPEELADQFDPTWRERPWRPDLAEGTERDAVPEVRTEDDILRDQIARMRVKPRSF